MSVAVICLFIRILLTYLRYKVYIFIIFHVSLQEATGIFSLQVLIPSVLILFVHGLSNGLGKHIAAGTSNSVYVGND